MSQAEFQRRVSRWAPVGGFALASTPDKLIADASEAQDEDITILPYPEEGE
jgi:hypothetical protein